MIAILIGNQQIRRRPMQYEVTMVITNTYFVDADNEQDAELKVRDLGVWDTLDGADYDVTKVVPDPFNEIGESPPGNPWD